MKDDMILESFGARAGIPKMFEGLQRPNTPSLASSVYHAFANLQGAGDENALQKELRNPVSSFAGKQNLANESLGHISDLIMKETRSPQNLATESKKQEYAPGVPIKTVKVSEIAFSKAENSIDGNGPSKNLGFINEITEILDRYEYNLAAKSKTSGLGVQSSTVTVSPRFLSPWRPL